MYVPKLKGRTMIRKVALALLVSAVASTAKAGVSGDPNDFYVLSDAVNEVYQFDRLPAFPHVPGVYAGVLGGSYSNVFSNQGEVGTIYPYLGAVAGTNQDFFIGGFSGLTKIDSTSGAFIQSVGAAGLRLGPAKAPNGNLVVGGPTGVEEYNPNTGAFVRTVVGSGDGANLHAFNGNSMYVANWYGGSGFGIKRYNFVSGASLGADIAVPFAPQEIGFGPDGALYATALYEGPGVEGLWRYDSGLNSWSQFIDVQSLAGGGPHGFTYDPVTFDCFMAFNTGEIYRFNGYTGAYIDQPNFVPTKLTDVLFKEVIPEPATIGLLILGAGFVIRRRSR
ncbi:MAG: hypothetical protein B6D36_16305 [Planctomycetes bacterium UTPLA1]|jgi:hypothetical protein|nr:MAG: hypothetical protein B6D36_16305 [Planctomycetes bacterium UTPLA1]